jgi:hypothetical protein
MICVIFFIGFTSHDWRNRKHCVLDVPNVRPESAQSSMTFVTRGDDIYHMTPQEDFLRL